MAIFLLRLADGQDHEVEGRYYFCMQMCQKRKNHECDPVCVNRYVPADYCPDALKFEEETKDDSGFWF